ncbi:Flp pilus assembly protein CpaB [Propionibacteriaceae bacterium G1746]|uniref:Flp pilus assembly protein CpaB n=1 Tax=Aestuariimicrobium sp. G57 TaxID=3418485 RepID=UPI003C23E60A
MKRRVAAAILASVLAIAGVVMIAFYVRGADQRAIANLEPTSVLVVTREIPRGQVAKLGTNVEQRQLPASAVPPGVVTDLKSLEGKVADTTLHPGEQLFSSRFTNPEALTNDAVVVPPQLVQVTVKLAPERVLGGQLKAGDTVGVTASWKTTDSVSYTMPMLHKVLVTRVSSTTAQADTGQSAAPAEQLITLAVASTDADRIVWTAEHGTIWLTLERQTSNTSGGRIVTLPTGAPNPLTAASPTASAGS